MPNGSFAADGSITVGVPAVIVVPLIVKAVATSPTPLETLATTPVVGEAEVT